MNALVTAPTKLSMGQTRELFHLSLCQEKDFRFNADATAHGLDYNCTVYFNNIEEYLERINAIDAQAHEECSVELITLYDRESDLEIDVGNYHQAKIIVDALNNGGKTPEDIKHLEILIRESDHGLNWFNVIEWAETHFQTDVESIEDYAKDDYKDKYPSIEKDEIFYCIDWTKIGNHLINNFEGELIDGKLYNH